MDVSTERDDLLIAHAAGVLPEALSLGVASLASLRADVRRALSDYEAIAGTLLEDGETASLSAGLREQLLSRQVEEPIRPIGDDERLPEPLRGFVDKTIEGLPWRRLVPGLRDYVLPGLSSGTARLLWAKSGVRILTHTRRGLEMTLVLEGAFSDPSGTYGPGDLQIADDSVEHSPITVRGAP